MSEVKTVFTVVFIAMLMAIICIFAFDIEDLFDNIAQIDERMTNFERYCGA
jgi:hypothetical protein